MTAATFWRTALLIVFAGMVYLAVTQILRWQADNDYERRVSEASARLQSRRDEANTSTAARSLDADQADARKAIEPSADEAEHEIGRETFKGE